MFSELKSIDSPWDSLLFPSEWIFKFGTQVALRLSASLINSVNDTAQGGLGVRALLPALAWESRRNPSGSGGGRGGDS